MARTPVLAAGGIVLRREAPPRFAVVRLRMRNEWVLPKGKLDDGETPRDAAEREVLIVLGAAGFGSFKRRREEGRGRKVGGFLLPFFVTPQPRASEIGANLRFVSP